MFKFTPQPDLKGFDQFCFFQCEREIEQMAEEIKLTSIVSVGAAMDRLGRDDPVATDRLWRTRLPKKLCKTGVDAVLLGKWTNTREGEVFKDRVGDKLKVDTSLIVFWDSVVLNDAWVCVAGEASGDGVWIPYSVESINGLRKLVECPAMDTFGVLPAECVGSFIYRVTFRFSEMDITECRISGVSHLCPKDMYHWNEIAEPNEMGIVLHGRK